MQFLKTFAQRFRQRQCLARATEPVIEGLEVRRLFAAGYGLWPGPNDTIIDFNGGAVRFAPGLHAGQTWLVVCGTDDADTIKITPAGNGGKDWLVEINGQSQVFTDPTGQGVRGLEIDGYGGDDHLELNVTSANLNGSYLLWNDVWGGEGDDTIIGADIDSWGDDSLYGDGGNDTIVGRGGDDDIEGGSGNDDLSGGDGADTIWGDRYGAPSSPGDTYDGGAGADDVNGVHEQQLTSWDVYLGGVQLKYRASDESNGYGTLFISGTTGDDNVRLSVDPNDANMLVITANGHSHSVAASDLADSLFLWIGTDDGDDVIDLSLSAADMSTFGFSTSDRPQLRPGHGDDVVLGSGAADYIVAGYGRDTVHAGGGDDVVELHYGLYSDAHGGDGNDTITVSESYAFDPVTRRILDYRPGTEMLYGDDGTDTINGVVEPADPEPLPDEELQQSMADDVLPFVGPMQPDVYAAWMTAQQGILGGDMSTGDVSGAPTSAMLNWAPPVSSGEDDALSTWADEHEDDEVLG